MNDQNHDTHATDPADDKGTPADRRPLGYWLRTVDGLLTRELAGVFASEGVSRGDWMLLNALAGDVDPALAERIARKGKRLRGLERRGWAEEQGDGTWTLTDEGRAAHARLGAAVDGIRARVASAVSPEDFTTTMASLEAIARELGVDEPASPHGFARFGGRRRGFGPAFGPGFGCRGGRHGHGAHAHDAHHPHGHGHGHGHGRHDHDAHPHGTERAYERGFDAGYERGAAERV